MGLISLRSSPRSVGARSAGRAALGLCRWARRAAAAIPLLAPAPASAAAPPPVITAPASVPVTQTAPDVLTFDVAGIPSMDSLRSLTNFVMFVWIGPFNTVKGAGYDVYLQTLAPGSLLSDIRVLMHNSAGHPGPNVGLRPGVNDPNPGGPTRFVRPVSNFSPIFTPPQALADGLIRLEFFDSPDEAPGEPDGLWVSGSFSILTEHPIPVSPGAAGLFAVAGAAALRRRRRPS